MKVFYNNIKPKYRLTYFDIYSKFSYKLLINIINDKVYDIFGLITK